jgi:hypothetical protein
MDRGSRKIYEKIRRDLHRKIREKFHLLRRKDSVPHSSGKRYSRYDLADLFGELGFNRGAEIGVRRGNFSCQLLKRNPHLHLTLIDPWDAYTRGYDQVKQDGIFEQCKRAVQPYSDRVTIIRKNSFEGLENIEDESLDFVFIDGNHTFDYVAPDIINWSKKVRRHGIVSIHDYYHFGWAGVVHAVDAYTRSHHIDPWYVTKEHEPTAYWLKP